MLSFQSYNLKSPLNGEGAQWVERNPDFVPLDATDFSAILDTGEAVGRDEQGRLIAGTECDSWHYHRLGWLSYLFFLYQAALPRVFLDQLSETSAAAAPNASELLARTFDSPPHRKLAVEFPRQFPAMIPTILSRNHAAGTVAITEASDVTQLNTIKH